ncbi:alkene reductase [Burkholderia sp. Nafp2/4-1b]|uniref:alkene reductase n=1 Tax=Burkholderia sp. Nafp2/4-1b TaxID=2116686 RepID=UPI000EF89B6A|nr:alkene reductase [Burkholderia sp. Nafp2/4-1b]RKT99412.1 alkene reductase [Burkholderia sp. Nafp2/4-1b]
MTTLFDPIRLGDIEAPNRIFMAPMTRARGTRDHLPTSIMAQYYAQRASAGLIISEAIGISRQGLGWPFATGLWSDEQVAGWLRVTDAVHAAGGRIIAQLWHMGRTVHPSFNGGVQPLSASGTTAPGHAHTYNGKQPYVTGRPMRADEVPALLDAFRRATRNALRAGFDGVQVHAANGYLIDEFLRDGTNFRNDAYGGSVENRVRLLKEVTQAVIEIAGAGRTGVRLTPNGTDQGVRDSDPEPVFVAAARTLSVLGVAHLELREPPIDGTFGASDRPAFSPAIRKAFAGVTILNSDYGLDRAVAAISSDEADAIAFGRPFIANPDLPLRFSAGAPLAADMGELWFTQGPEGYLDYPALA